ncbi:MAG: conserved rane protein of unknown function, partial [Klenkia sp.]|nr:conserved rane protein of unknown function [Klenkia sp.]
MSSTVALDDTVAFARVRPPRAPATTTGGGRRPPVTAVAAGSLAVLEAVGLLAVGLTSLDGLWGSGLRPPVGLVVVTLVALAGWVVLAAGGGAGLVDGSGGRLLVAVAVGELGVLVVGGLALGFDGDGVRHVPAGSSAVPVPALVLLALAVPLGKLLLATTPSRRPGARPPPAG